ncbi:FecCD family ABC transporter permease [Curtobacterium ammoniigenes]|uniref:FecCD family ABC transporter permease n=1 Tax=Curtobacterium ammoniigenes TaxID=395387 RepID=UPI000A5C2A22|nr:iron chelate uptake ABC transporter family permease subunit [Curtobacterium ammoniigenes]
MLLAALAACVLLAGVALSVGAVPLTPGQLVQGAFGHGDRVATLVVTVLRGPRVAAAALVGASLAVAGGIVQSVVRNPIASPDVMGITTGASAAGLAALAFGGATGLLLVAAVLFGALATAALVGVLAWRGSIESTRLILVGIGVAALGASVTGWVLTRGSVEQAAVALQWLTGSVSAVDPRAIGVLAMLLVVGLAAAMLHRRALANLALGDPMAAALGVPVQSTKIVLLAIAVVLTGAAVAVAGPVAFIALIAAPIARRLLGDGRPALGTAAAVGAALGQASDLIGQFAIPNVELPIGVVTGIVGAPYLLWLIARSR